MEQIQKASLVLKTSVLPPPVIVRNLDGTEIIAVLDGVDFRGMTNAHRTKMTWNNINLRLLLGDMYEKYDNFNLQLVNIGSDDNRTFVDGVPTVFSTIEPSDRTNTIYMSGMNFLNATYDCETNQIGTKAALTTYEFYDNFARDIQGSIFTFTKGNEVCNITIEYKDIKSDTFPATAVAFPNMVFIFNIYGIPREIKKLN